VEVGVTRYPVGAAALPVFVTHVNVVWNLGTRKVAASRLRAECENTRLER
jgi:hypothetical protein